MPNIKHGSTSSVSKLMPEPATVNVLQEWLVLGINDVNVIYKVLDFANVSGFSFPTYLLRVGRFIALDLLSLSLNPFLRFFTKFFFRPVTEDAQVSSRRAFNYGSLVCFEDDVRCDIRCLS